MVEGTYRIQEDHCLSLNLPWNKRKAQKSAQLMFKLMWEFKWLPPGRGLWMMGTSYVREKTSAALFNCGFISTENMSLEGPSSLGWAMDMSMLGVGIGFDTDGVGTPIAAVGLPPLAVNWGKHKPSEPAPPPSTRVLTVDDSREGWVEAYMAFIRPYFDPKAPIYDTVDVSGVREAGQPISGFGGTSSGPGPLVELLEDSRIILRRVEGKELDSTAIVDLFNLVGRCVVSGNIRRSAMIALGNPLDSDFSLLKHPDHQEIVPEWGTTPFLHHRWSSNNSNGGKVGDSYVLPAKNIAENGEPGFVWLDNARAFSRMGRPADYKDRAVKGVNPCSEQTLQSRELCCLSEVFPSMHGSLDDLNPTLKMAYLYAKTVTLLPTHDARTNAIQMANRRIGLSQTGIVQARTKFGTRNLFNALDSSYDFVTELDKTYSDWLCVRESIKRTSVKPSGTVSLLPGVTPGVHFPHSQYYIRRIRFSTTSPLVADLIAAGYKVEEDVYSPNTMVVEFPVEEEFFDRCKDDVSMWEQLELAAAMQHYWADNAVSVTVTFNKQEAQHIAHALELYETRLKGVSFLPISESGYVQAPYETISKEEYLARKAVITELKVTGLTHDTTEAFCDGGLCSLPVPDSEEE